MSEEQYGSNDDNQIADDNVDINQTADDNIVSDKHDSQE